MRSDRFEQYVLPLANFPASSYDTIPAEPEVRAAAGARNFNKGDKDSLRHGGKLQVVRIPEDILKLHEDRVGCLGWPSLLGGPPHAAQHPVVYVSAITGGPRRLRCITMRPQARRRPQMGGRSSRTRRAPTTPQERWSGYCKLMSWHIGHRHLHVSLLR